MFFKQKGYLQFLYGNHLYVIKLLSFCLAVNNICFSSKLSLLIGVPSPPRDFNFDGLVNGVPTFTFIGGFNGGSDQTFIVETAIHGTKNWKEQIRFKENDNTFQTNERHTYSFNLTGLSPNKYDVRVLAENSQGMIEEIMAVSFEFTIEGRYRLSLLYYNLFINVTQFCVSLYCSIKFLILFECMYKINSNILHTLFCDLVLP